MSENTNSPGGGGWLAPRRQPGRAALGALLALLLGLAGTRLHAATGPSNTTTAGTASTAPTPGTRPRIGLVLSGGGARGLAHIGVLKALQAQRIPVDLVVGTSMGAVVGGAFAAGRSVEDLETLVAEADWNSILADRPGRRELAQRRREDDRMLASRLEFGLGPEGVMLPAAAAGNSALEFTLDSLAPDARAETPLPLLPLPFKALATDLVNGRLVVLDDVPLSLALRASMAVPGLFSPVRVKDRLLVDGGLVRNLGVDIARQMGADVVIAVNVGSPLLDEQQIQSALSVTDQMIKILTTQNVERSLAELRQSDFLITPEMPGLGLTDFERSAGAIREGELATADMAAQLHALALSQEEYAQHEARRNAALWPMAATLPLGTLRIEGSRFTNPEALKKELGLESGQPVSRADVQLASAQLYGRGDFERVQTQIQDHGEQRDVLIKVTEAPWTRSRLRLGIELASDFKSFNRNTLAALHTLSWLNDWGAELRTSAKLGGYREFKTALMQPLGPGSAWYVEPSVEYLGIRDSESLKPYQWNLSQTGLALGRQMGFWGDLQLVGLRIHSDYRDADRQIRATFSLPELRWRRDTLDAPAFPARGTLIHVALRRYPVTLNGRPSTYQTRVMRAFRSGDWAGHVYGALAGSFNSVDVELPQGEGLGGFLRLSGSEPSSKTQSYAFGRLVLARKIGQMPIGLGDTLRIGASLEFGNERSVPFGETGLRRQTRSAASTFLAIDSRFGPVYLGLGSTRDGGSRLYFVVGPVW